MHHEVTSEDRKQRKCIMKTRCNTGNKTVEVFHEVTRYHRGTRFLKKDNIKTWCKTGNKTRPDATHKEQDKAGKKKKKCSRQ